MKPLTITTLGVAGLLTGGLLALPVAAQATDDTAVKRDEDSADVVLVVEDDDDDLDQDEALGRDLTDAYSRVARADDTNTRDNTRTGSRSGRDNSRNRLVKDWTRDGGDRTRDWSRNQTNDRSRHNTR